MNRQQGSGDTLFTIFSALCAVAAILAAVFVGSSVARSTFKPHAGHSQTTEH